MKKNKSLIYLVDQFISSGSSFLVLLLTLLQLDSAETSRLFFLLAVYAIYISISQSILGESLLVQYRNRSQRIAVRTYTLSACRVCIPLSLTATVFLLLVGFDFFVALFCFFTFSVLGLQDALRFYCIAENRIRILLGSDVIWFIGTPILFFINPGITIYRCLFNWAVPGYCGAALMFYSVIKTLLQDSDGEAFKILSSNHVFLPLEVVSGAVSSFFAMFFLMSTLGFESIAILRVMQSIFGLVNIVINTGKTIGVKFASRSNSYQVFFRAVFRDSIYVSTASCLAAVLLYSMPEDIFDFFASKSILISIRSLFGFFIVERICVGFLMSVTVLERANENLVRSSLIRAICFPFSAILGCLGVSFFDSLIAFTLGSAGVYFFSALVLSNFYLRRK